MKKCKFIYNPESGKKFLFKNPFKNYESILNKYDYEVEIIATECKGHATKLVEESEYVDLLIVAGGDGTINEAITGNLRREKKLLLGIIPVGTMNDVGNMLGYGMNPDKNLEMMLNGVEKNIDICLINGKAFVYVACLGKFVNISYKTPRELKKQYGRLGYIIYGLKEVGGELEFYDVNYKVDGIEYMGKYSFIFITNSTRVGGVSGIYPDVKLDDNMFEVALINIKNKAQILKSVQMLLTQDLKDIPGITLYKTNNFEITFSESFNNSWCIDGEEYEYNGKTFKFSVDKSMNMLLPARNVKQLFEEK